MQSKTSSIETVYSAVGTVYLAAVCHDIRSNTLEATWLEVTETDLKRVACRNYSLEQKARFLADTGSDGQKYVDMAGW